MAILRKVGDRLVREEDHETVWIEAWGPDALRVRATKEPFMPQEDWALLPREDDRQEVHTRGRPMAARIEIAEGCASISNGAIRAEIARSGKLSFFGARAQPIVVESLRNRKDILSEDCSALEIEAREFKPIIGGDYEITARFESIDPEERIYGMGQYQQPFLDLKGTELELAQRNSQASVPFYLSSLGYGFLWNNPSVGRASFAKNGTTWHASSSKALDYWVVAADRPADLMERYTGATGRAPMMPDFAMGFWQCKLRYQTQEELLAVAGEYKRRGLPLSVIVVDFFHWPTQGDWRFDPTYWPDPEAMIAQLKGMGIELMVSVWPTVDYRSENFAEMRDLGLLIRTERGIRVSMDFQGNSLHFDATRPEAREYVWGKVKKNYYDKGIRVFWLDEAEPEYTVYDFDNYRYHLGSDLAVGNIYPLMYARAFYEGMEAAGQERILNLIRCAWAGSQRYGALVWSGDIHSSWKSLRCQVAAGLSMGIAGIPWWTTDIGGFHGGDPSDPGFRELFARWFEYGTFCPVMRLHGDREPKQPQVGASGGASCRSGAPNEVWSYGEEIYTICARHIELRERMRPSIAKAMSAAHERGVPPMRPLFFDYPEETEAWEIEDQFLFCDSYLVAPVLSPGARSRNVYLPKGMWKSIHGGPQLEGGRSIECEAPLEWIPVFEKA
jgi:Alpha-glucosidases, family 31 of glycosyl hydrolases